MEKQDQSCDTSAETPASSNDIKTLIDDIVKGQIPHQQPSAKFHSSSPAQSAEILEKMYEQSMADQKIMDGILSIRVRTLKHKNCRNFPS